MPVISTISAYQTSAEQFFGRIRAAGADLVLDVRLKNESQLCGFTKRTDLAYFIPLICGADYVWEPRLAPDPTLLERYLKHWIPWEEYASEYRAAMLERDAVGQFRALWGGRASVCLIGTATDRRRSHSEVLAELLACGG
jgi:Uncharacterized conserved protein